MPRQVFSIQLHEKFFIYAAGGLSGGLGLRVEVEAPGSSSRLAVGRSVRGWQNRITKGPLGVRAFVFSVFCQRLRPRGVGLYTAYSMAYSPKTALRPTQKKSSKKQVVTVLVSGWACPPALNRLC